MLKWSLKQLLENAEKQKKYRRKKSKHWHLHPYAKYFLWLFFLVRKLRNFKGIPYLQNRRDWTKYLTVLIKNSSWHGRAWLLRETKKRKSNVEGRMLFPSWNKNIFVRCWLQLHISTIKKKTHKTLKISTTIKRKIKQLQSSGWKHISI